MKGALRSTLNDHGPITRESNLASAAKRIVNQLYGATAPTSVTERLEALTRREQAHLRRIEELEAALMAFAVAGYNQSWRRAAWLESTFVPAGPDDEQTIAIRDGDIDRALEALGIVREVEDGLEIDTPRLEAELRKGKG